MTEQLNDAAERQGRLQQVAVTEGEIVSAVVIALQDVGATMPSKAVRTRTLVAQMELNGFRGAGETEGEQSRELGVKLAALASNNGPLKHFGTFVGGAPEMWLGVEWWVRVAVKETKPETGQVFFAKKK